MVTFDPAYEIEDNFEGSVIFVVTADTVTGTLDGDVQLQGSGDGTNWVNLGSTVAIADATSVAIPLTGNTLYYNEYRVQLTGVGTQSTTINGSVTIKGRK